MARLTCNDGYSVQPGGCRVRDLPARLRPREAMARLGVRNVTDDVLLAILLRSGVRGVSVIEVSRRLITRFGSLTNLAKADRNELESMDGLGPVKVQVLMAALELARRLSQEAVPERPAIRSPEDVSRLLREEARRLECEVFWVLLLDTKNRLIGSPVEISRGLLDASLVHAREVFREAVRASAYSVVLAHNHPSGDPTPSAEDLSITRMLHESGKIMDIRVLDHVILGDTARRPAFLSLREEGIVDFSERST